MLNVTRSVSGSDGSAATGGPVPVYSVDAEDTDEAETFVTDVDQLAAHLMRRAVSKVDVPVELMQKRHKVEVVRDLKARGMFHLKDAIDMVATALGVTRFTIYNYLNEIADEDGADDESVARAMPAGEDN
jgi:predicted transcriptional regulator YheO